MKSLEALRQLGTGGEAPLDAKQRVYGAVLASLAAAAAAGTATAGTAAAAKATALPAAAPSLLAGLGNAKALALAGGIWLVGGATGAALYGALSPREVRVVYVDRPVLSTSAAAAATAQAPTPTPSAAPTPTTASATPALTAVDPRGKRAASPTAGPGSELARERSLLDLAREHAAHGEPALVLEQTQRHRAQFPHGKLAEEREALAIRALLALGHPNEARARAQEFRRVYPNSLLTPMIDSALPAP